jgi:hypothetical protein
MKDATGLNQDIDKWRTLINIVMNFWISKDVRIFD